MMVRFLKVIYLLGIEILFGGVLLIGLYFSMQEQQAPLIPYLTLSFLVGSGFVWLLQKFQKKGKLLYLIILLPLLIVIGYPFFPIPLTLLMGVLIFVRTLSHFNDPENESEGMWILYTFAVGSIALLFTVSSDELYNIQILLLLLIQLTFSMAGRFIIRLLLDDTSKQEKHGYVRFFIGVIGALTIISIIISGSLNIFRMIFLWVFNGLAYTVGTLASPLLNWADNLELEHDEEKKQEKEPTEFFPKEEEAVRDSVTFFDPAFIISTLFFLGLIFLFIYVFKRKKANQSIEPAKSADFYSIFESEISSNNLFNLMEKQKVPINTIRKEIFEFEKYAGKLLLGRKRYESFEDWMIRLGLENYEKINFIYEKVRYGEDDHQIADEVFKNEVKMKKKELKLLQKALMESGEMEKPKKRWRGISKSEKREALRSIFKGK